MSWLAFVKGNRVIKQWKVIFNVSKRTIFLWGVRLRNKKPRKIKPVPFSRFLLRLLNSMIDGYPNAKFTYPIDTSCWYWQQQFCRATACFKKWHQLFHEDMAFSKQIENLCEEQILNLCRSSMNWWIIHYLGIMWSKWEHKI